MSPLELNKDLHYIGNGKERTCYVHPKDPAIAIKITHGDIDKQTKRELKYYRQLAWRKGVEFNHIPRYLGKVETNLGVGHTFDLIRDHDGEISKSLLEYLESGTPISHFDADLDNLRQSLLSNTIIFNNDMYAGNILFKKKPDGKGDLVVIDGLGDTVLIDWLNIFKSERAKKIERRWGRFNKSLRHMASKIEERKPRKVC